MGVNGMADLAHNIADGHRPFCPEQPVKRHGAEKRKARIDDVKLGELVRQPLVLAHEVDGLADRPERRHGDEIRRHQPAGGILRIFQTALQRDALRQRHRRQNLVEVRLVEILQDLHRIVGIELADGIGDFGVG